MFVIPSLQKGYSNAIYGNENRVSNNTLVIWLDIANEQNTSLEFLHETGICSFNSFPPKQPFFVGHDVQVNTKNMIWVRHTLPHTPVPPNTWTEITHCANPSISGAMWTYYAPGSGVSMNVGNTLVTRHRRHAMKLLMSWGLLEKNNKKICHAKSYNNTYDTIQVLDGFEYYSREPRHEIIFLRHRECDKVFTHTTGVKCGKYPELFSCSKEHLKRMNTCGWYNNVLTSKFYKFYRKNKQNCSYV